MSDLLCVFQDLYDSEINFEILIFWDAGFSDLKNEKRIRQKRAS